MDGQGGPSVLEGHVAAPQHGLPTQPSSVQPPHFRQLRGCVWAELRRGEKDNESENKRQSEFHILCAAILKLSEWEVI